MGRASPTGLVPGAAYHALGRGFGQRSGVLVLVWAASQVPLYFYLLFTALFVADLTYCGPDAYECPF